MERGTTGPEIRKIIFTLVKSQKMEINCQILYLIMILTIKLHDYAISDKAFVGKPVNKLMPTLNTFSRLPSLSYMPPVTLTIMNKIISMTVPCSHKHMTL